MVGEKKTAKTHHDRPGGRSFELLLLLLVLLLSVALLGLGMFSGIWVGVVLAETGGAPRSPVLLGLGVGFGYPQE